MHWRSPSGEDRYLDIEVVPLVVAGTDLGMSITFADVTEAHALQAELERSRHELETAYEEIQSTVEELETTNEELQSTNEELETTNEELQSTNEELETMNEELQSTNEELETINTELHDRTSDLNKANVFLESVLGGVRAGVIVLDGDFNVQSWNAQAKSSGDWERATFSGRASSPSTSAYRSISSGTTSARSQEGRRTEPRAWSER